MLLACRRVQGEAGDACRLASRGQRSRRRRRVRHAQPGSLNALLTLTYCCCYCSCSSRAIAAMDNAPEAPQQSLLHLPDALLRRIALLLNPLDRWGAEAVWMQRERTRTGPACPAARRCRRSLLLLCRRLLPISCHLQLQLCACQPLRMPSSVRTTAQAGLLVGAEQSICPPLQVPAMPRQPAPVSPWGMNQQSCGPTWTWPFTCLTCTA